jgi:hypothetical protein
MNFTAMKTIGDCHAAESTQTFANLSDLPVPLLS